MKVKSRLELELRDLPYIESPFFAASYAAELIDHPVSDVPRNRSGKEMSVKALERELRDGHLFLIGGKPLSPIVVWETDSDHPNGGFWRLKRDGGGPGLRNQIESLNKWEVTPEIISHVGAGGVGHMNVCGFDCTMTNRRADERYLAKQEADRRSTLPLGTAALVAPLVPAASLAQTPENGQAKKEEQRKPVHLEVGIFTDGTLNNAGNIEIYRQQVEETCLVPHSNGEIDDAECERRLALLLGGSYANEISNVAKLRDLYPEVENEAETMINQSFSVYAPGAGSKTGAPDSLEGMTTGLGETGVTEQVKNGFTEVAERIAILVNERPIAKLTVDLFGFSRGGAAARHAANEIAKGSDGELGQSLAAMGIQWPERVTIRFVGLFDTVAGIVNITGGDLSPSNARNTPVNLYLDPATVSTAVQFTAVDECRENFALNSLCNPDGSLPRNFREIMVPGAHSDIGGGYHDSQTEELMLSPKLTIGGSATAWPEQTPQWDNLATLKGVTEAEGWIGTRSLPLTTGEPASLGIHKTVREHPVPDGEVGLDLKLHRQVRGELSRVYLHCMYHLAKRAGVPLKDIRTAKNAAEVPKELDLAYRILWEHISLGKNLPELPPLQKELVKQRYVHHSDHYNLLEFLIGDTIVSSELPFSNARFLSPFRPAPERKRIVYNNQPET
ncbi:MULTISPECIES: DUF2235 domain-containing protein [Marinobacter]|jgi:hypothetical protein|uniref:Uncharacterized alpha/beta hydrolase domain n=3 Tax=Marinobacter TaxID=2742 RepID=A0ABY1FMP8_9GAMM|nr:MULTISPECIES: DUF2235 domain-containing protein [Marinobacter]HCS26462.1 DUF2235 domain-containing protein [Spongiibacteraceae bacterium]KXJ42819.1 MAG: hypothetical protein AXW11_05745 [Marinobacter sp. Hex_13]MBJ7275098.1 DUF2235 domain-containing protein [Marinobacter salarius]MBL83418.1 type IV secretion protein Rhs [Marinobacter sp.]MBS8232344.1 DUF2235 domain-containing protein [Marinobacter salarius]|tara:strand:+ start:6699 stop:8720 length:2022 start_codon:yes stop_codon:yes gene_type:complete